MIPTPETHLALHRAHLSTLQRENERRRALREARELARRQDTPTPPRRLRPFLRLRRAA